MRLTPVVPALGETRDIATDAGRRWLAELYAVPDERHVRLNMITTLTGSAVGADGTSETLTSRVDRALLGIIRAHADVVLVGAQTVRAEGYVVPRHARLAILTTTGDLRGHRLGGATADRVIVLCPAHRVDAVRARSGLPGARIVGIAPSPGADLSPADAVRALAELGLARIVCEGGPRLGGAFAASGLIDELCVTVAPAIVPAASPFLHLPADAHLDTEVAGMLVDENAFSYLRLRPRRPDPAVSASR